MLLLNAVGKALVRGAGFLSQHSNAVAQVGDLDGEVAQAAGHLVDLAVTCSMRSNLSSIVIFSFSVAEQSSGSGDLSTPRRVHSDGRMMGPQRTPFFLSSHNLAPMADVVTVWSFLP